MISRNAYILLAFFFASCQQVIIIPNAKKIAAIQKQVDDTYRNNWTTKQLLGHVKSMSEYFYEKEVKDTTAPYHLKDYYSFDTTGNIIERISYNSDRFDNRNVYKYNKDNKNIETLTYSEEGHVVFNTYKVFDSTGNLIEEGQHHPDRKTTYKCDARNNVIASEINGQTTRFDNKYDNEAVLIGKKATFNDGKEGREEWRHDSLGNVLEHGQYFMDGKLFHKEEYAFNNLNQLTKITITDKDNQVTVLEYVYDAHGNAIENYRMHSQAGKRSKAFSAHYEYDDAGNWTKRVRRDSKDNVTEVVIRGIKYY